MKNPLVIILGVILLAILGGQTYLIYNLQQRLDTNSKIPERPFPHPSLDDKFFDDTWDPYQEMQRMQNNMERLFSSALSRFHMNQDIDAFTKMPALDLKEEAGRYIVKMDIPGADLSTLTVDLEDRQLSISIKTERRHDEDDGQNFKHRERFTGTFQRSLTLPEAVKESAMTSEYKNGVLTLIIPKA